MKSDTVKDSLAIFRADDSEFNSGIEADLRRILAETNLENQRAFMQALAAKLNVDVLDCASALLFWCRQKAVVNYFPYSNRTPFSGRVNAAKIKMVRYRVEVGHNHGITADELRKILIAESGVDKNNINIIDIQANCTYIELPDEMPQDIFLHLKSIQVREQKFDIKRLKNRIGKKKPRKRSRQHRQGKLKTSGQEQNAG